MGSVSVSKTAAWTRLGWPVISSSMTDLKWTEAFEQFFREL